MPGKRLNSQAQNLVANLLHYFEEEKYNRGPLLSVDSVYERVASALKISVRTVYNIMKRGTSSPGKQIPRRKPKTKDLPESLKMEVRNTLYDMFHQKKHVTLKTLKAELETKQMVQIGKTSLSILLKHIGFKYKKDDNRRALMENLDVSMKRGYFPKDRNRKEKVYEIDELLRNAGHEILRLPPYHCDFNAIELIWAKAKTYYNVHIGRAGYTDEKVKEMWKEALHTCDSNTWSNCIRHTDNLIKQWYERENCLVDLDIDPVIINVTESSTESDSDSD